MKKTLILALACALTACAVPRDPQTLDRSIVDEINAAAAAKPQPARDTAIDQALIPPLRLELPKVDDRELEPRFDVSVNDAPAQQVLLAIVSGTRYSMLVHPDVAGTITVDLKDTTVPEALEALRELYGYEYRIDGNRIIVQAASLQTRVFRVNYLAGQRLGRSELRVISGSVADAGTASPGAAAAAAAIPTAVGGQPGTQGSTSRVTDSARVLTSTSTDFWRDLEQTLKVIVGTEPGRNVVVNPQAGVIVVRGMPADMRNVQDYLRAIKLSVERQVMIEAKIIEVTLSDAYQAGINWAVFGKGKFAGGVMGPGAQLSNVGEISARNRGIFASPENPVREIGTGAVSSVTEAAGLPGGLFGLAFQTHNFAAVLEFLEGQGSVQVLSSPRIAALNNQKAVLKVGTDEFFITNVQSGNTTSGVIGGNTTSFPTLTLQPFFSGVSLDITPQIDDASNVILHVHPSVSNVVQDNRQINLGDLFGENIVLPLARSTVSETDSVVKVADGNIVAIGGLMKVDISDSKSGLPGLQNVPVLGNAFGSRDRVAVKKELVILIKPTIIGGETNSDDIGGARDRLLSLGARRGGAVAD